jgi:hypothetical protein
MYWFPDTMIHMTSNRMLGVSGPFETAMLSQLDESMLRVTTHSLQPSWHAYSKQAPKTTAIFYNGNRTGHNRKG